MDSNGLINTKKEYRDYIVDRCNDILKIIDQGYENITFCNLYSVFEEVPSQIKTELENIIGYMDMLDDGRETDNSDHAKCRESYIESYGYVK